MSKPMKGFGGFSESSARLTPIPDQFFWDLLPAIDDLAELKTTLYLMRLAAAKSGRYRFVSLSELVEEEALLKGLPHTGMTAEQALLEALERASARGTLLTVRQPETDSGEIYYFVNTPLGREAVQAIEDGRWMPADEWEPGSLEPDRPNIFRLYEQNIGLLTPLLAERLAEAEDEYPADWIEDALRIALANNVRNWRYIEAILEEWNTKGRDEREDRRDPEASRRKYTSGKYSEFIAD